MSNPWALTEYQKEIDIYLQSAVRLYGHIPPRQFLLIFNRFHKDHKLLKGDLVKWMHKLNYQSDVYTIYTNAIINQTVPLPVIDMIIEYQQGKPFKYPETTDAFLKWANPEYYPVTEYSNRLSRFFLTEGKVLPLSIHSLMCELFHSVLMDQKMQSQMDIMIKYRVPERLSIPEYQEMIELFMDFCNNSIHWANCGYTPNEMNTVLRKNQEGK